jgi:hypothetical protein
MSISISGIRLSFIWMEPTEHLFEDPVPDEPFAFLGRERGYSERFASVQRYEADPDGLTPPWPKHKEENFWFYCLCQDPHTVDPARAWRHFVPLRWRPEVAVEPVTLPGRVDVEAFFYPHGQALLISTDIRPPDRGTAWSPEEAAEAAHRLRFDSELSHRRTDGTKRALKLESFARIVLERMRTASRGQKGPTVNLTPYSVVTFTRVTGADPAAELHEGGQVHRMLEALTRWSKSWRIAPLSPLAGAVVPDPKEPAGHAVYAGGSGRAIWLPNLARPDSGHRFITCYHRNQAFAALQVESVGALVRRTADARRHGRDVPFPQYQCARLATGFLGRLYGAPKKKTYRSLACFRHMHDREIVPDLAYLREQYDLPELHAAVAARPVAPAGSTTPPDPPATD